MPTPAEGSHTWDIGAGAATTADIRKGDRIVVALWARAPAGSGEIAARMHESEAPYSGIAEAAVKPTSTWQLFQFEGTAARDYPAGHATITLTLTLNSRQQVLDVGPAYVFKNPKLIGDLQKQVLATQR